MNVIKDGVYIWRNTSNGDYFVMPTEYFDCINYDLIYTMKLIGRAGSRESVLCVDIFTLVLALMNMRAHKYVDYFTSMYEILNERTEQ